MHKNPKFLYSVIAILILVIILIGGFIFLKDSSLIKGDNQKWSEFKPVLIKDSKAFNDFYVKSDEVSKKHYEVVKDIDCQKLVDYKDKGNCQKYKEITIKQIEKPDQINKKALGNYSDYELWLSGAFNF